MFMVEARNNFIFADGRMAVLCEATISIYICSMRIFQGKTKICMHTVYNSQTPDPPADFLHKCELLKQSLYSNAMGQDFMWHNG